MRGISWLLRRRTLRHFIIPIIAIDVKSKVRKLELKCKSLSDYFNCIQKIKSPLLPTPPYPIQNRYEITDLLRKLFERKIKFALEIGTAEGGTFYLLCKVARPDATIITVDIASSILLKNLLPIYAQPKQTVVAVKGNSHCPETIKYITHLLNGNELDLLFIDGDHSYEAVKKDFYDYSPLVRKGGWVVFHDIVPDYHTRYGTRTISNTGEVPKFWNQIKRHHRYLEIIEDPKQDGFGIGVLTWNNVQEVTK